MRTALSSFSLAAAAVAVALCVGCDDDTSSQPTSTTTTTSTGGGANGGHGGAGDGGDGGHGAGGGGGAAGGQGGGIADSCAIVPGGSGSTRVRVVAANLTSGNMQSYDGGQGIRILQGIDADVVLMQEMNFGSNSDAAIGDLAEQVCGSDCPYVRGPQEQIPNGVVSRLPMLGCGSWVDPEVSNRTFVWARIDVPGSADLWAISVHLLSSSSSKRNLEATALLGHIAAAIPAGDMIVLGGDLNTNTRGEAAISTLSSQFVTAGPYPADHVGNSDTNEPRNEPYDWLLADTDLDPTEVPVTIGSSVFSAGAVIDTRVYQPLSEIAPALAGDSGASGMQHMAVVRDFQLQ